MGKITT
jgi:hypothetical protein